MHVADGTCFPTTPFFWFAAFCFCPHQIARLKNEKAQLLNDVDKLKLSPEPMESAAQLRQHDKKVNPNLMAATE